MYWNPTCFTWCAHPACGAEGEEVPCAVGLCDHCGRSDGLVMVFCARDVPYLDTEMCELPAGCTAQGDYNGLHHENYIILWPTHLMCLDLTDFNAWIRMRAWRAVLRGQHSMFMTNHVALPGWEVLDSAEWRTGKRHRTTEYARHVYQGEHDRFQVNRWGVAPWTRDGESGLEFRIELNFNFDDGSSRGDTASSAVHELSLEIRLSDLALLMADETDEYR